MRLRSRDIAASVNVRSRRRSAQNNIENRGRGRGRIPPSEQERRRQPIYCGNNNLHPSLLEIDGNPAERRKGTPLECMRKGWVHGYSKDVDPGYVGDYEPIYPVEKAWCGRLELSDEELRDRNYTKNGSLVECYRTGFGGGKRSKAGRGRGRGGRGRGRGRGSG